MDRLLTRARPVLAGLLLAAGLAAGSPATAADPGHGKSLFNAQCSVCHTASKGGGTLVGPNLFGVVGRSAGTLAGYSYSPAMKASGLKWSDEELQTYLAAPVKTLPGIKMTYNGVKNPAALDDLIAYLDTLK
jgi:cytochrome c